MNVRRKPAWTPEPQLTSVDLADIRQRYVTSEAKARLPVQVYADLDAMWHEIDKLRFELAGANERARIARLERDDTNDRYWRLQMTVVPGGPV